MKHCSFRSMPDDARRIAAGLTSTVAVCVVLAAASPSQAAQPTDVSALSLEQLLQVTVVGATKYEQKQSEVAAAVTVITRQEIRTYGWRTLGEALASLPGVSTTYDRQYGYLGMRGFGLPGDLNTRTLITINGNRVNDPVFDQGPNGRDFPLDMDLVERIEFIPGPGGAVYGQNAMFGVVNVITRTAKEAEGTELAGAWEQKSSQVEGRASWGGTLRGDVEVLLSLSGLHARGRDLPFDYGGAGVSGVAAGLDGERNKQLFAHVGSGPWSFDIVLGNRRKYDPTGAYLSDPLVPGQFQEDRRSVTQLQYKDRFAGESMELLARVFMGSERYNSRLSFGGTLFAGPAVGEWRGAEVRLLSTAIAGHKLMLGTELQDNVRQDQFNLNFGDPASDISIRNSGYRAGLYAQDEWRVAETLSATLGWRIDRDKVTGSKSSPRAALIWNPRSATTLKALFGRAHRSPNSFERDYHDDTTQVSNPALSGETIDTVELVVDQRAGADLAFRASAYQWTMRDLVTLGLDPVSGLSQYQSGGQVRAHGLELSADKTWPSGARLRGSVAFQDVAYANGDRPLNSPAMLGKLNVSAPLSVSGWVAGYELRYDSKRRTIDGTELGGYAVSNLNLSTRALAKGVDLSLAVWNLFDKRYAQPGSQTNWQNAIEQDRRSVRVKLVYNY